MPHEYSWEIAKFYDLTKPVAVKIKIWTDIFVRQTGSYMKPLVLEHFHHTDTWSTSHKLFKLDVNTLKYTM